MHLRTAYCSTKQRLQAPHRPWGHSACRPASVSVQKSQRRVSRCQQRLWGCRGNKVERGRTDSWGLNKKQSVSGKTAFVLDTARGKENESETSTLQGSKATKQAANTQNQHNAQTALYSQSNPARSQSRQPTRRRAASTDTPPREHQKMAAAWCDHGERHCVPWMPAAALCTPGAGHQRAGAAGAAQDPLPAAIVSSSQGWRSEVLGL